MSPPSSGIHPILSARPRVYPRPLVGRVPAKPERRRHGGREGQGRGHLGRRQGHGQGEGRRGDRRPEHRGGGQGRPGEGEAQEGQGRGQGGRRGSPGQDQRGLRIREPARPGRCSRGEPDREGRAMRSVLVRGGLAAAIVMASTMWAWPASAGGGCHQDRNTEGQGDTVTMSKACFEPGVLPVDPGTEVTFVNQDPITHNVSGTGWGYYEEMNRGDAFRATFDEPGVYPFACMYHPGMTGAIVVGDGIGPGSEVAVGSLDTADSGTAGAAHHPNPSGSGGDSAGLEGQGGGGGRLPRGRGPVRPPPPPA